MRNLNLNEFYLICGGTKNDGVGGDEHADSGIIYAFVKTYLMGEFLGGVYDTIYDFARETTDSNLSFSKEL